MKFPSIMAAVALLACAVAAPTQPRPEELVITRIAQPVVGEPIDLRPHSGPATANAEIWYEMWGQTMVRNVTRPTLTPFLPDPARATGAAVLVVPGGGFQFVSMSNEGWPIARWLADQGIAAFVLKYRLEPTPSDDPAFRSALIARFEAPRTSTPEPEMMPVIDRAREDAQAALRLIRANADQWGIDRRRVGMIGFSAGAMTTLATTLANAPDARPDFIAPIYGFMSAVTPPPDPQPMFVAMAADDPLFNRQGFGLIESWHAAGGSTELHWYSGGGHGFGSRTMGTTSDHWFAHFMTWMRVQRLLDRSDGQ